MSAQRKYAADGISDGSRSPKWLRAHRQALVAGDLDDCDHGVQLPLCGVPDCCDLYDRIVQTYMERNATSKETS